MQPRRLRAPRQSSRDISAGRELSSEIRSSLGGKYGAAFETNDLSTGSFSPSKCQKFVAVTSKRTDDGCL